MNKRTGNYKKERKQMLPSDLLYQHLFALQSLGLESYKRAKSIHKFDSSESTCFFCLGTKSLERIVFVGMYPMLPEVIANQFYFDKPPTFFFFAPN
ncbi:unnamed protein product [Ixodes persulcatus]